MTETNEPNPTTATRRDAPGVIIFPPLLYVGTLLLGLALNYFWPLRWFTWPWWRAIGGSLAVAAGLFAMWGSRTMKRAGTNVLPSKPALAIVSTGPFRFTRNPLYLANAVVYLGLAAVFNSVWPLVLFVPMVLVIHWGIIRREERYLEAKFDDTYLEYKARVRRWL